MTALGRNIRQKVQADGELPVGGIEVGEVVGAVGREMVQQLIGEIAVGINEANAVPQGEVLEDQVPQQGGLAGTGLADEVEVLALVGGGNAKRLGFTPAGPFTEDDVVGVVHGFKISRPSRFGGSPLVAGLPVVPWRFSARRRQLRGEQAGGVMGGWC